MVTIAAGCVLLAINVVLCACIYLRRSLLLRRRRADKRRDEEKVYGEMMTRHLDNQTWPPRQRVLNVHPISSLGGYDLRRNGPDDAQTTTGDVINYDVTLDDVTARTFPRSNGCGGEPTGLYLAAQIPAHHHLYNNCCHPATASTASKPLSQRSADTTIYNGNR